MNRSGWIGAGIAVFVAGGCSAQSCSALAPLPSGFPASERASNATQVRVSQTGIAKLEAEPAIVASQLFGGSLAYDVPVNCAGSPTTCCTGGTPVSPCGPIVFDVAPQPGDLPRLVLTPVQGSSRIDLTLRARVSTTTDVPVNIPLVGDCGVRIDTLPGTSQDIQISVPLTFPQDAIAGTTRLVPGSVSLTGLSTDDVALVGGFACQAATFGLSSFIGILTDTLSSQIQSGLSQSLCKACPSGDVAECGPFASACTSQVCMTGNECLQELGLAGRLFAGALFAGAPPGNAGALDLYEVAGGYATTNASGAALGVLAGMIPSGAARDRCGPPATAPTPVVIPQSAYFQGNTRPDTGAPFDVAIGLHTSELEQLWYAAYEGGVLCPTVDSTAVATLTSDALATLIPSLSNLTGGNRPIAVGLRPQAPPTFVLGANTFDASQAVVDPLVDLSFAGMEIDLFANVEDQPLRVLTLVADVRVPIGVRIDTAGKLVPVLGAQAGPLNVTVKSSEPLQEAASALTALAPVLLQEALPELVRRVGLLQMPPFVGMDLAFTSVTTVDSQSFVGFFADLQAPAAAAPPVAPGDRTDVLGPAPESPALVRAPRAEPRPVAGDPLRLGLLALTGLALLYVARRRSLRWAVPGALLVFALSVPVACGSDGSSQGTSPEGGTGGAGGQNTSGSGGTVGQGGTDGGIDGGGTDGGSTGGSGNACGATACLPGDVLHGELGQWNAADTGTRTVVTSYDALLGDLVLVELTGGTDTRRVIDGVPSVTPTHDPAGYRGGIADAGPDVGAWTSVRLAASRVAIAYQDRDRAALRAAFEDANGVYQPHDVDDSVDPAVQIGAYASLAIGTTPSIAYLATGVPGANNTVLTELRLATATVATPTASTDWTTTVVTSGVATATASTLLDLPEGPGAFVNLIVLADGRRVLVHYDRTRRALLAHTESTAGSNTFTERVLDGGGALDRGRWVSAVADSAGLVHAAYEDAVGHQVFYLTFTPGGAVGTPEVVDDGTRAADRPHWVGAGLALWLDTGPRIAYQDAATANVVIATKSTSWSHADQTTGAPLDGFHLAAPPRGTGPLVWDQMSSASAASHRLVIVAAP